MKKAYTKPLLFAESYQMAEHIAANCSGSDYTANHNTGWTCSIRGAYSGLTFFTAQQSACSASGSEDPGNMNEIVDGNVISDSMMSSMIGALCYNQFEQGQMFSSY